MTPTKESLQFSNNSNVQHYIATYNHRKVDEALQQKEITQFIERLLGARHHHPSLP